MLNQIPMTTWAILFVVFGFIAVISLVRYMTIGMTRYEALLMVVSIIIAAVSAGYIWG